MTATYNYLGYGITDSNGKAKLEYDSEGNPLTHSYTGTGAGKVDIVASLDSEITESSLVSETFVLYDTLFYEKGVTGDPITNWLLLGSNGTLTRKSEYSVIKDGDNTSGGVVYFIKDPNANTNWKFPPSIMIELDIKRCDGLATNQILTPRQNNSNTNQSFSMNWLGISDTNWHSIGIKLTPTKMEGFVNGSKVNEMNVTGETSYWTFGIWTSVNITEVQFKNVKVYPI
jgi:hypothetical protein